MFAAPILKRSFFALAGTTATLFLFLLCTAPSPIQSKNHPKRQLKITEQNLPITNSSSTAYNVIFDLNGVLFKIDKKKALAHLGFMNMVSYTMAGKSSDDLELKMFDMIHQLHGDTTESYTVGDALVPLHNGRPLPYLVCEWMRGMISSEEIIQQLEPLIEKLDTQNYFSSNLEKRIIKKIIYIMFDPAIRAQMYVPLKKGVLLLKQCAQSGNNVYLLSNMDSELITELREIYPDIFDLFHGSIISADVKMIKPNPDIYNYALTNYGLDPKKCCFIDDQKENIIGAENVGLMAFQFSDKVAKKIRKKLAFMGVVPAKGHELNAA